MAYNNRKPFVQDDPTKGNFQAYKNFSANQGNSQPAFTGRITLPVSQEMRSFSLWASRSHKTGDIILSGPVTPDRQKQWDNLAPTSDSKPELDKYVAMADGSDGFAVKPHHMVLFTSPNTEIAEGKKAPPKMFGYYNPGGEYPLVVISAFEHADRNSNIMLLGPVEAYDPEKTYQQSMDSAFKDESGQDEQEQDGPFDNLSQEVPAHLIPQKKGRRSRSADDGPDR